jgi:altronate hydrolase
VLQYIAMNAALIIHASDTVAVALEDLVVGQTVEVAGQRLKIGNPVPRGHKFAVRNHCTGAPVIKYGHSIGLSTAPITIGDHVHSHNLATALSAEFSCTYAPNLSLRREPLHATWHGYRRHTGQCATRNEVWIIPTVGCVARTAELLARDFASQLVRYPNVDGVHAFSHAFGCSQMGDDLRNTQRILARLVDHPNAGAVLVLGLGCENNNWESFRQFIDPGADDGRVRYLEAQASSDEHADGLELLELLAEMANRSTREVLDTSELTIGLKCGGSDGFSGVTANPLLGRLAERVAASNGRVVLTEVPEMFGAEQSLLSRCASNSVFEHAVSMIRGFRQYYVAHDQPVSENPSPGNKAGGITTLEEKSLGCVQKAGEAAISDVVQYGGAVSKPGLTLLQSPGNDQVSCTALAAAGCHLILFTTGRGTPLGSPVPTVKVASNHPLAERKPKWIDFDAGVLALGADRAAVDEAFLKKVLAIAGGQPARNEENHQRDIAILKGGVTL